MITASMYIGEAVGSFIKNEPNILNIATAAVDTVSASVQTAPSTN